MTGAEAYAEDCRRCPTYPFGNRAQRPGWDELPAYVQASWIKNPTPRVWANAA